MIFNYQPVAKPLSLVCDIIIAMNGIVYQWNKEENINTKPISTAFQTTKSYKKKLLIFYTVILKVMIQ